MIYFISDTHFGHKNIIKYCNRPFQDIEEMEKVLIQNWNGRVKKNDTVYFLGDFVFGSKNKTSEIAKKLNGIKILIMGNHDIRSQDFYKSIGFVKVYDKPIILDNKYILSHEPMINVNIGKLINIHGHIHNTVLDKNDFLLYNVSCENIDYTPVSITQIEKYFDTV